MKEIFGVFEERRATRINLPYPHVDSGCGCRDCVWQEQQNKLARGTKKISNVNRVVAEGFLTTFGAQSHINKLPVYRAVGRHKVFRKFLIKELTWREREQLWVDNGTYKPPVWKDQSWWTESSECYRDHYAHVSIDDSTMIAFTESEEKGEQNRQTKMKPGKYLRKFFEDELSEREIAYFAEWFVKGVAPQRDAKLKFASKEEDMMMVYEKGPSSCMKSLPFVKVYAAGDLQLAYLQDKDTTIIARALCWPARKTFGRVYPTPDNYEEDEFPCEEVANEIQQDLTNRLIALGWKQLYQKPGGFDGARLRRIRAINDESFGEGYARREAQDEGKYYVMPYLDCDLYIEIYNDDWFVVNQNTQHNIGHGTWASRDTQGLMWIANGSENYKTSIKRPDLEVEAPKVEEPAPWPDAVSTVRFTEEDIVTLALNTLR